MNGKTLESVNAGHPADDMIRDVDYELSEEELARSLAMTPLQRLQWLDEARQFTLLARTAMQQEYAVKEQRLPMAKSLR